MEATLRGNYCGVKTREWQGKTYYSFGLLQGMNSIMIDCTADDYYLVKGLDMYKPLEVEADIFANCKGERSWISARCRGLKCGS